MTEVVLYISLAIFGGLGFYPALRDDIHDMGHDSEEIRRRGRSGVFIDCAFIVFFIGVMFQIYGIFFL